MPDSTPTARHTSTARSIASALLILLAIGFIGVGGLTAWMKVQVLSTEQWTETSREAIQRPEIQSAVATWTVDQVFELTNPAEALADLLPPRAAPLAGPLTSRLRTEAYDVAETAMADPRVEEVWVKANQRAHERFVRVIHGDAPIVVETSSGIRIDLRPLLERVADRIGVNPELVDKVPAKIATVEPKRSEEFERVLKALRLLDKWGAVITFLALPLLIGGIALAANRRTAWMWAGAGLIGVSLAIGVVHDALGPALASMLTESTTWRAAILATWEVASEVLDEAARVGIFVGLLTILIAWSTGPGSVARGLRNTLSPVLDRPAITIAIFAVLSVLAFSQLPAFEHTRIGVKLVLLVGACAAGWLLTKADRDSTGTPAPVAVTVDDAPAVTAPTDDESTS